MSSNPVQPYAVLNEVKYKLNISLTDTSQDDQITVATNDANNYIAEQTAVHAVVVTAGDDPSLSSMANNLAAAYFNFWISTDKSREEIELWQDRIQQYIMAKYGLKSANMLSGDQTFGITGGFGGEASSSGGGSGGGGNGGGEANTASNLGAGEGLFAQKVGVDLQFKSLVAGTNVTLSSDGDTVTINSSGAGAGTLSGLIIDTNKDWLGFEITELGLIDFDNASGTNPTLSAVDSASESTLLLGSNFRITSGFADFAEISTPANPATDTGRLYVADDTGTTTLFFRDSAGTETNLLDTGNNGITSINADATFAQTLTGGTGIDIVDNLSGDHSFAIDSTVATSSNNLSFFSPTSSAQLAGVISDETGSGLLVFGTSPSLITPGIADFTNATHDHESTGGAGQLTATLSLDATGTPDDTNFLRGDNTWIAPSLDNLTDVTISGADQEQVLVNDGAGQWVNQLLTAAQLPSTIAYTDLTNSFGPTQQFPGGLQLATNANLDLEGGFISDVRDFTLNEQSVDPTLVDITKATIFLDDAVTFGSPDPLLAVMINRDGAITKKPIVTSETVFALNQFSNGMFTEETGTELVDPLLADTMRVQIFNESDTGATFEVVLEGIIFVIQSPNISLSISNSLNLAVGTPTAPVKHSVWIFNDNGTPTMTSSTMGFPMGGDFAVVGTFSLQDKASILTDGPYSTNSPDYEIKDSDIRGHLAHINDRLVELDAVYISGINMTVTPDVGGGTAAEVSFVSDEGVAFELHKETIEAYDSTNVTSILAVLNENTQQPDEVTRVTNIGTDIVGLETPSGVTIATNQAFNLVLYTIHSDTEPNQTNYGINLPQNVYTGGSRVQDAIDDISGFTIRTVPNNIRGIVLLISEVTISITGGGATFEVSAIKDIRGLSPGVSGGGTTGGGGATSLDGLSDVTIGQIATATGQILELAADSQWRNVPNPAGLLAADNTWTGFQDYTEQLAPIDPATTEVRFYAKRIDGTNQGLFCKLEQDGGIVELQLA